MAIASLLVARILRISKLLRLTLRALGNNIPVSELSDAYPIRSFRKRSLKFEAEHSTSAYTAMRTILFV